MSFSLFMYFIDSRLFFLYIFQRNDLGWSGAIMIVIENIQMIDVDRTVEGIEITDRMILCGNLEILGQILGVIEEILLIEKKLQMAIKGFIVMSVIRVWNKMMVNFIVLGVPEEWAVEIGMISFTKGNENEVHQETRDEIAEVTELKMNMMTTSTGNEIVLSSQVHSRFIQKTIPWIETLDTFLKNSLVSFIVQSRNYTTILNHLNILVLMSMKINTWTSKVITVL